VAAPAAPAVAGGDVTAAPVADAPSPPDPLILVAPEPTDDAPDVQTAIVPSGDVAEEPITIPEPIEQADDPDPVMDEVDPVQELADPLGV
jgi:hypothetical protein